MQMTLACRVGLLVPVTAQRPLHGESCDTRYADRGAWRMVTGTGLAERSSLARLAQYQSEHATERRS